MDKQLAQMVRMGFTWQRAERALQDANGDTHAAINLLLSESVADEGGLTSTAMMEPEPEPACAASLPVRSAEADPSDRLRARAAHQSATLAMLREAGASADELRVLLADVERLEAQVAEHAANEAAAYRAREASARAHDEAAAQARRARELERQREEAAASRRLAAQQEAQAQAEQALELEREIEAEMARNREQNERAEAALREAVAAELAVAEQADVAEQEFAAQLLQSRMAMEWQATFGDPITATDSASGAQVTHVLC